MKNKLRELRAAKNWSQSDLADQLGVSRQTINAIETEKYDPSLPLAFKVARLFKKPIEEIFELDPIEPRTAPSHPSRDHLSGLGTAPAPGAAGDALVVGTPAVALTSCQALFPGIRTKNTARNESRLTFKKVRR